MNSTSIPSIDNNSTMMTRSLQILVDSAPILYLFAFFGLVAMLTSMVSFLAIVKSKEMTSKFYALYAEMAVVDFMLGMVFICNSKLHYIIVVEYY